MTLPDHIKIEATRDLTDLVAIPSVSARVDGLDACADKVAALLADAGFQTAIEPGDVGPFVTGEIGEGPFTLVIYNHYDVQPEEPVNLWTAPPFSLTERHARSSAAVRQTTRANSSAALPDGACSGNDTPAPYPSA